MNQFRLHIYCRTKYKFVVDTKIVCNNNYLQESTLSLLFWLKFLELGAPVARAVDYWSVTVAELILLKLLSSSSFSTLKSVALSKLSGENISKDFLPTF